MSTTLKIQSVYNGYILEKISTFADGEKQIETSVYQEEPYNDDPHDSLRELLWAIADELGYLSSKYDKKRLKIGIEHGEDYECTDNECKICAEAILDSEEYD